jgi:hypothetical protein
MSAVYRIPENIVFAPAVRTGYFNEILTGIGPMSSRLRITKPALLPPQILKVAALWKRPPPYPLSFRAVLLSGLIPVLLAGCGFGAPPKLAERPDVIITLGGKPHVCLVALDKEPQGNAVPCKEAVSFVKDELRLQAGGIYDIHTVANVDNAEVVSLRDALNAAGYRFIGGRKLP